MSNILRVAIVQHEPDFPTHLISIDSNPNWFYTPGIDCKKQVKLWNSEERVHFDVGFNKVWFFMFLTNKLLLLMWIRPSLSFSIASTSPSSQIHSHSPIGQIIFLF